MKILCTKDEFTELAKTCNPFKDECKGCVLEPMCDSKKQLLEMCNIQEETNEQ